MARSKSPDSPALKNGMQSENVRPRGSGVKTVYEELRRGILDLSIPPGTLLDEAQLSTRFAMSRTPIREALVKLAAENLVTTLPNRNTIVPAIDFARLPAYFDALTLMYRVSTRSAAQNHTEQDMVTIRHYQQAFADAVERRDALSMISENREFHVAIALAGANSYYTDFFARLLDEGRRILRLYYTSFDDRLPRQYVQEHEDMVRAIAARDVSLCDSLAKAHAEQIVQQIQSYLGNGKQSALDLG
ncbi:GntR family transcriptional regulator [Thalassospiraceae bacterium SW-3-3]|nr:GntR family transcriptional regulator [Thalassospiraceae bacterium SW-3-3]